jgi:hypothetical protein
VIEGYAVQSAEQERSAGQEPSAFQIGTFDQPRGAASDRLDAGKRCDKVQRLRPERFQCKRRQEMWLQLMPLSIICAISAAPNIFSSKCVKLKKRFGGGEKNAMPASQLPS